MKQLTNLVREIISVIIGILIALVINNWNEERKDQEYLDQIFASITKELKESHLELETEIPKQMALLDSLDSNLNNEDKSIYEIVLSADGIHSPQIKTNSWNALSSTKIELIDYEKLSKLAGIEEWKGNLENRTEKLLEYLFQNFESTERQKKEIAKFMVYDIISSEKRFQNTIQDVLSEEFSSENE